MKYHISFAIGLFAFLVWECHGEKVIRDIRYIEGTSDTNRFNFCRLDLKLPEITGFRTVVWFHGGGMTAGNKHFIRIGADIAQVAVNYRLLSSGSSVRGKDCIDDAAAAVAWTLKHIGEYGGDPNKVYVSGMSAGGYLTLMVGMAPEYLAKYGFKPMDLAGIAPISGQATKHYNVRVFDGDKESQYVPKIDQLAPLYWVSKNIPPIFDICGEPPWEWKCRNEENRLLVASCVALGHDKAYFISEPFCDHERAQIVGETYVDLFVHGKIPEDARVK